MKIYKVSVFNTVTRKMETVEVTKEVYTVYMQTQWQTTNSNRSYRCHNCNISELGFGFDEYFENIERFIDDCEAAFREDQERAELKRQLDCALSRLSDKDRDLIKAIYYDGFSEKEYASETGVSQPMIHKKKERILLALQKILQEISC